LDIAADSGVSNKINFAGTGILDIEHAAQWGANVGLSTYAGPLIQSFGVGDKFDFEDVGFVANTTTSSYDPTTGRLQITGGSTPASLLFDNATLGGTTFSVTNDGTGHTLVMRS
jgi:hypothetical protein